VAQAAAVILAGGRGERLGGAIKANIEIGGARLIGRVFRAVSDGAPVLVARGRFSETELSLPAGAIAIADADGAEGPLAGVAGAIHWLGRQKSAPAFLVSVAVDTPFFPADFLFEALRTIGGADAVVARFAGQDYPTNALWRVNAAAPLVDGATSLKQLLGMIETVPLEWDIARGENPFANVNTLDELYALKRRAAAHFGVGKGGQTG
jgi:molybdopterin-guanine dinucleotide biosynthesis protein A